MTFYCIICREPLAYYQTTAIAEGRTYQLSVETITDVDGDTANVTIRKDVPLQPPGETLNFICMRVYVVVCVCVCVYVLSIYAYVNMHV